MRVLNDERGLIRFLNCEVDIIKFMLEESGHYLYVLWQHRSLSHHLIYSLEVCTKFRLKLNQFQMRYSHKINCDAFYQNPTELGRDRNWEVANKYKSLNKAI